MDTISLTSELPGKEFDPPSRKVAIDMQLDEVVLRALEEKPGLRYQQVSELKSRVETLARQDSLRAAAPPRRFLHSFPRRCPLRFSCYST